MRSLVENLRAALKERIEALPWMGAETKKEALEEAGRLPREDRLPRRVARLLGPRDLPGVVLRERGARPPFETKRNLAKLGKPIDRTEWRMTPPTVNAYYNSSMNEIVFPAGILQPPFFYADADDAVNYGGIGVVIGHEMSHGFDDSGSQYDADGNLKNWWTDEDRKAYDARTALVVKQFDGYKPLPDQAINGKLTLGENIGDLGGLKISYAALAKALGREPAKAAPVDGFTPGPALLPELRRRLAEPDPRRGAPRQASTPTRTAPASGASSAPLSNLPEFDAAFGCAAGHADGASRGRAAEHLVGRSRV